MRCLGIETKGIIFDTMLASYVKDTNRNHELDIQALENLDHAITPFAPFEREKKNS